MIKDLTELIKGGTRPFLAVLAFIFLFAAEYEGLHFSTEFTAVCYGAVGVYVIPRTIQRVRGKL